MTVVGRVCRGRKIHLTVESIGKATVTSSPSPETSRLRSPVPCKSYNEELAHWNAALVLRESHYFNNTPFVIPEVTVPPEETAHALPTEQALPQSHPSPTRRGSKRSTPDDQERIPSTYQPVGPLALFSLFAYLTRNDLPSQNPLSSYGTLRRCTNAI